METFAPSSVERFGGAVFLVYQLIPHLSGMRRLSYLLLPMITLFKLEVFGMVPHIV
jgi:hypothetical protein